jgi:hypothetical protein
MFGKKKAGAIAAGLSLVMALSPVAAFAATPSVTKSLQMNDGSTVTATFEFAGEKRQLTASNGDKTVATDDAAFPGITIDDMAFTNATKGAENVSKSITLDKAFTHAGVYAWEVTETPDTYKGTGDMQYDTTHYTVTATVTNKKGEAAVEGEHAADLAVAWKVANKYDGTTAPAGAAKSDDLSFTNKYTEKSNNDDPKGQTPGTLTITKQLGGNQGDTTKDFSFTVTFSVPSDFVLPADYASVDAYMTAVGATKNDQGAYVATFTLKAGETKTFNNLIAGTKYSITEAEDSAYTQSYAAVANGENKTEQSNLLIGEKANTGTMTNTHKDVTPTGIVINNMPYIVMAGAAVAGVVAYGAAKRKLEQ